MLEEKLRQASESSTRQRHRMVLMAVVILVFSVVIAVALSLFDSKMQQTSTTQSLPVHKLASEIDQSVLREQFMQRLGSYERELEPGIVGANLKSWNMEKDVALAVLKEKSLSAFGTGDYATALKKLTELEVNAKETLKQRDTSFASEMIGAEHALSQDDYTKGTLHITKALLLKQDDQQAQRLAQKIELLPELLRLIKKADIAAIENNPQKEYDLLVQATNIAPDREVLKQRRNVLAERIRENQFSSFINRGLVSVEKKDIRTARLHYKKAQSLFSGRPELRVLSDAILKISGELDLKQSITRANRAIAEDDWIRAQSVYAESYRRHADDKTIIDGLQLANKIVSLQQNLADYINRPQRLASRNVLAAARDEVVQADVIASYSKSLSAKSAELKTLLASMNVKIAVFVKSDNQTYILVRGVGKVGLTSGREIQLKPGEYIFEGSRAGYRSKLVQVRIPAGETSFMVEVVCDERI